MSAAFLALKRISALMISTMPEELLNCLLERPTVIDGLVGHSRSVECVQKTSTVAVTSKNMHFGASIESVPMLEPQKRVQNLT